MSEFKVDLDFKTLAISRMVVNKEIERWETSIDGCQSRVIQSLESVKGDLEKLMSTGYVMIIEE